MTAWRKSIGGWPLALLICTVAASGLHAQFDVPAFRLPPSNQLSPEARAIVQRIPSTSAPAAIASDVARRRAFYGAFNDARLAEMDRAFATVRTRRTINGVAVDVVDPAAGIAPENRGRVLINVHGGAFIWGSGSGALVEAVPIAATMRVRVIAVDYRLAPEHRYPAASEDVTAVYRELLKRHAPGAIGIYGCSAGGVIAAQATAWIRKAGLPRPGAIGTFCSTGSPISGDSAYLAGPTMGGEPVIGALPPDRAGPYLAGVSPKDGQAYPLESVEETRSMPPTLLLAGSRDFAASALTLAHRRLAAAGVTSELFLFDGLPHAFFVWPNMPESREAYRLVAGFFDRHLARGGAR